MHRSRFGGLIIDCQGGDLDEAAGFWGAALGRPARQHPDSAEAKYRSLAGPPGQPYVEVQRVEHASRVHLDIETDDIEAEATRLEALGARRIGPVRDWLVMEAPTGQRFCLVPVCSDDFERHANRWPPGERDS